MTISKFLDRALTVSLFLLALSAPISIAATQTAWAFGLLVWIVRAFFVRPVVRRQGFDLALLAFVGLSFISSVFSYEPAVSMRKMVAVALVTIVYLVSEHIRDKQTLRRLVTLVLISGTFTAAYAIGTFVAGKNLKVLQLTADSPLRTAGIIEGDTILRARGRDVSSPDELAAGLSSSSDPVAKIDIYRSEWVVTIDIAVPPGASSGPEALGIVNWSRGRDTRAAGFFGHYTTYAEAVQLLASLAFGLLIMVPGGFLSRNRVLLAAAVGAMAIGLFLTVTRASWAGFLVSATAMVLIGASRKTILICVLCAIPLVFAGLAYLQQKRNVGFIDTSDNSTTYRETVWREGFNVLVSSPRHLAVGIGMDSVKKHWQDWKMFDNGRLMIGHMHSTPLQIAFERGVPALIAWFVFAFIYLRMLWRGFRRTDIEWPERGVLLGAFGGMIGFLTGGVVHYNLGDSEVAMILYLIMGFSLAILRVIPDASPGVAEPAVQVVT